MAHPDEFTWQDRGHEAVISTAFGVCSFIFFPTVGHPHMEDTVAPPPPRYLMLLLSFVQGVVLLALWRALDNGVWPGDTPAVNYPLWTLAIVWPGMLLLGLESTHRLRTVALTSGFVALLMPLTAYAGWQASPFGEFFVASLLAWLIASLLVACLLALPMLKHLATCHPLDYAAWFARSWRAFLVTIIGVVTVAGLYLVLYLFGLLFAAIGIDFVIELLSEDWILFPLLAVALGQSVSIFRRLENVINGIANLLCVLMRLLLPLVLGVAAVFLAALPFTGLKPLWGTDNGTILLLWLNAIALFCVNGAYRSSEGNVYPRHLHRAIAVGVGLLPVISALATYGLSMRIGQHGWSVSRCQGVLVCALLAGLSVAYAVCVVWRRTRWTGLLGRVNVAFACCVLAAMLLVNTPLLDFRSISLDSQLQRVEAGEIALAEFDFDYAKNQLARPGWLQMQTWIAEHEDANPALVRRIRRAPGQTAVAGELTGELDWSLVAHRPSPFKVPQAVLRLFERTLADSSDWGVYFNAKEWHRSKRFLVRADVDADGSEDYVLVRFVAGSQHSDDVFALCAYWRDGRWNVRLLTPPPTPLVDVDESLQSGVAEVVPPAFMDLKVGELTFHDRGRVGRLD